MCLTKKDCIDVTLVFNTHYSKQSQNDLQMIAIATLTIAIATLPIAISSQNVQTIAITKFCNCDEITSPDHEYTI